MLFASLCLSPDHPKMLHWNKHPYGVFPVAGRQEDTEEPSPEEELKLVTSWLSINEGNLPEEVINRVKEKMERARALIKLSEEGLTPDPEDEKVESADYKDSTDLEGNLSLLIQQVGEYFQARTRLTNANAKLAEAELQRNQGPIQNG